MYRHPETKPFEKQLFTKGYRLRNRFQFSSEEECTHVDTRKRVSYEDLEDVDYLPVEKNDRFAPSTESKWGLTDISNDQPIELNYQSITLSAHNGNFMSKNVNDYDAELHLQKEPGGDPEKISVFSRLGANRPVISESPLISSDIVESKNGDIDKNYSAFDASSKMLRDQSHKRSSSRSSHLNTKLPTNSNQSDDTDTRDTKRFAGNEQRRFADHSRSLKTPVPKENRRTSANEKRSNNSQSRNSSSRHMRRRHTSPGRRLSHSVGKNEERERSKRKRSRSTDRESCYHRSKRRRPRSIERKLNRLGRTGHLPSSERNRRNSYSRSSHFNGENGRWPSPTQRNGDECRSNEYESHLDSYLYDRNQTNNTESKNGYSLSRFEQRENFEQQGYNNLHENNSHINYSDTHNTDINFANYARRHEFRNSRINSQWSTSTTGSNTRNTKQPGKFGQKPYKRKRENGIMEANKKIDLDKITRMEPDEIAIHLSSNQKEFDIFLWKQTNIENISVLVDILGSLCKSSCKRSVQKAIYPLKERRFFDRFDVRKIICDLRSTESELTDIQLNLLTNLLLIMRGLTEYVHAEKADLLQSLDTLEITSRHKIKDLDKKDELDSIISSIRHNWDNRQLKHSDNKISFLSVLPDIDEVFSVGSHIDQKYEDEEGYLNRLFMVHRQDFIRPLCRGLVCLKRNLDDDPTCLERRWRHDDIRVYKNIQFLSKCCNRNNGITWIIRFDTTQYRNINWATRKLLIYGSLVCLTNITFDYIYYATVADRNPEDLRKGFVEIKLHGNSQINEIADQEEIILIESQAFFPSYYHTLESIKMTHFDVSHEKKALPFGKNIVYLNTNVDQPDYFESSIFQELGFDLRCFISFHRSVDISKESDWPHAKDLGLDTSQYEALITAVKSKLALIQGPPGTGKTVVGLKIAELFLQNEVIWGYDQNKTCGPMLLLSYTNHALDQFLSEILKRVPDLDEYNVVRLGSRSEDEELKKYNLTAHRQRYHRTDHIFDELPLFDAKDNLLARMQRHKHLNKMMKEVNTGIVHHLWLYNEGYMTRYHFECLQQYDDLIRWLGLKDLLIEYQTDLQRTEDIMYANDDFDYLDEDENNYEIDDETEDMNFSLGHQTCFEELLMSVSYDDELVEVRRNHTPLWHELSDQGRDMFMQKIEELIHSSIPLTGEEAQSIIDIWQLHYEDRWRLYKYWIKKVLNDLNDKICECEESYDRAQDRFKEVQRTIDVKILKNSRLIACTTTRAARDIDILRIVSPKIVLMEEAAEIPEHHVVSCLTSSCEQLIMIGDHQQLRPSYNDYHTAREHHVNISLFERLIRARYPCKCLKYQHRMRPTISKLLVPHIYKNLENDLSVQSYENVKGMLCNLYFVSHSVQEDNEREEASRSHKNTHEAKFISSLYKYLRLQGYKSSQITILSPYLDQVRMLRTMIRPIDDGLPIKENFRTQNSDSFQSGTRGVRIIAVDNFQGEENDIILISLVRSNFRQSIGYLKEPNRICVALSRAKIGLYLIGDFELLSSKSELWEKIVIDANDRGFCGKNMPLICQNHKLQTNVRDANDFRKVEDGGCNKKCSFKRECGHFCLRKCHIDESFHNEKCKKKCLETVCERGHKCTRTCHYPWRCNLCEELVEKALPKCGHSTRMPCHKDPSLGTCNERCQLIISCGHRCQRKCSAPCNTKDDCNELIKTTARCGHEVQVACHTKHDAPCKMKCEEILRCGHQCSGNCSDCSQGRLHVPCRKKCERTLVCGHICRKDCNSNCLPCTKKCERRCAHGDHCKKSCLDECIKCKERCNWNCKRTCPYGFKCNKACSDLCDRPKCYARCNKMLECGHLCPGLLCEDKCIEVCKECNKDEIAEICCFGTEDEDDPILIRLEDCKHIIEVETMDNYIKSKLEDDGNNDINALKCPKCHQTITKSNRYRNELKMINADIESVFKAVKNAADMLDFNNKRAQVISLMRKSTWNGDLKKIDKYKRSIKNTKSILQLNLISDTFTCLEEIANLKTNISSNGDYPFLLAWANRIESWILMKREKFSSQEHDEFSLETRRLKLTVDIHRFKKEFLDQRRESESFPKDINKHLCDLESKIKISDEDLSSISNEVKQVSSDMLGLSLEEKVMIKRAMESEFNGSGHWYKCSNGHYYSIGECGMPMEERQCPYCNVTIGGRSHLLSDQNERAMDMEVI